jgi:class 3 adenylate cyclase
MGLGLGLTLLIILLDGLGGLEPLERYLYDFRARHFQVFTPPPTDQIVHLDIDDPSLKEIGAFPWPRTRMAEMLDEINLAGAKVVGMDIIFAEPQEVRYIKQKEGTFDEIRDDDNLADAIKRGGNVLIPVSAELNDRNEKLKPTSRPSRLDEFSIAIPNDSPPLLRANSELPMIAVLNDAIRYSGVVQFTPEPDGFVRSVPLFIDYHGRLMPHMSLALACAQMGVSIQDVSLGRDRVIIPIKGSPPIVIPVRTIASKTFGPVGAFMNIPWFGAAGRESWQTLYDFPAHATMKQHYPLNFVWQIRQNAAKLAKISSDVDDAVRAAAQVVPSSPQLSNFLAKPDAQSRNAVLEPTLRELESIDAPSLEKTPAAELSPDDIMLLGSYRAIRDTVNLQRLIARERADLKQALSGKAVLIGWTATGKTDAYPTSIDPNMPGAAIQGVVFNAIMTRNFWATMPWWTAALATFIVGMSTTFFVARFPIGPAFFCTAAIVGGYVVINGLLLFDWGGKIVSLGAPIVAATAICFGVTVAKFIYEQTERLRITRRFSNYADPNLVRFVVQHPDVPLDGQMREMTVVFTDLEGFTTVSERLGPDVVPILNEYMSRMLPIIRGNRGHWNKFLGDGIMFFFNALDPNLDHALDAVVTVLQMQRATEQFNEALQARGLPRVAMRAGISSGNMIVGDAGSIDPKQSDFTVLGDEVNLGARLESANKALGTRTLLNGRAAELAGKSVLLRPAGTIVVAGKTHGVNAFEAICMREAANEKQLAMVELSRQIVEHFRTMAFDPCIQAARELESVCGVSKFTQLYIDLSRRYLIQPPPADFDGRIVLTEK